MILPAGLQPEHLAELKAQLRKAMAEVEAGEQRLVDRLQPQTLDEVGQLEEKLNDALAELARRRAELEGRERGQGA